MNKLDIDNYKGLMAHIYIRNGKAVHGLYDSSLVDDGDVIKIAQNYEQQCVDALIIFDLSKTEDEHYAHLLLIQKLASELVIPIIAGGHVNSLEDVDNLLRIGCRYVFLNMSTPNSMDLLSSASRTFGKDTIAVCIKEFSAISHERAFYKEFASFALLFGDDHHLYDAVRSLPLVCIPLLNNIDYNHIIALLKSDNVIGISGEVISNQSVDIYNLKESLINLGIPLRYRQANFSWSELKLNSDNMVPVIVQDYKNGQVLMMAYMNEEAYNRTIRSGRMTYWSRSRNELWIKGETSGHYQIVKELFIDCDNDTILAKVQQIGAACHTGNRTCFYRSLLKNSNKEADPIQILKKLYDDAKANYSNSSREHIIHDTTSILFHLTKLMARNDISLEEITDNLQEHNEF